MPQNKHSHLPKLKNISVNVDSIVAKDTTRSSESGGGQVDMLHTLRQVHRKVVKLWREGGYEWSTMRVHILTRHCKQDCQVLHESLSPTWHTCMYLSNKDTYMVWTVH